MTTTTNRFVEALFSIDTIVSENQDGNGDPLIALAELRTIAKAAKAAEEKMDELAQREAEKYPKEFERGGFKFTKSDGRAQYNFKGIEAWVLANAKLKGIEEKAKTAAQLALKGNIMATQDGEVEEAAIVTYTKSSLSIK